MDGQLTSVDLVTNKVGSPTGNLWLTVEAATTNVPATGKPANIVLATSQMLDAAASGQVARHFTFNPPAQVLAGQLHYLVLRGDFTIDGTNYVVWCESNVGGTLVDYRKAAKCVFNGTVWGVLTFQNTPIFRAYHARPL